MSFAPYLHFQGNCAAAMTFYAELFGAGDLAISRFADAPGMPPEMAGSDLVIHASLSVGGRLLMASDFPPGMEGDPQKAVSISFTAADTEQARALFDRIAGEGGAVIMPFGPTFWAQGFGMVRDRFGTHWMLSGPEDA